MTEPELEPVWSGPYDPNDFEAVQARILEIEDYDFPDWTEEEDEDE